MHAGQAVPLTMPGSLLSFGNGTFRRGCGCGGERGQIPNAEKRVKCHTDSGLSDAVRELLLTAVIVREKSDRR